MWWYTCKMPESKPSVECNADALSRLPLQRCHKRLPFQLHELVLMVDNLQDAPVTAIQIAAWTRPLYKLGGNFTAQGCCWLVSLSW